MHLGYLQNALIMNGASGNKKKVEERKITK